MKSARIRPIAIAVTGLMVACHSEKPSGSISIDGSATVYPLSQEMGRAYREANPAVQLGIQFSGTGGGFRKFCAGQVDIEAASRPIKAAEGEQCSGAHVEYIELPVAFDSLSVVVNPQNAFVQCLTVQELKTIWEPAAAGTINQWRQVRASFPNEHLSLFGPGKDSGTFDYFTLAIVGTEASSREDYTKSEDDEVIERGVAADPSALGYFGYAYYQANKEKLKLVAVDAGHGCVLPDAHTVSNRSYEPLSRPLFLYVNAAAARRPEVKSFMHFFLSSENASHVSKVGYVPLPNAALMVQTSRFDRGVTGSVLGGHGSVLGVGLDSFSGTDEKVKDLLVQ